MNDERGTFDMRPVTDPASLFDMRPVNPAVEGDTIQERFESFHSLNPWVYRAYERLTLHWIERGHRRIGIGMLTEVLRWQYGIRTHGDIFKINNNYRSRYVRMLIDAHPEWDEAFEIRELKAA